MDEGGVVEAGVDDDGADVELLVPQRLGRRAHVVLAQPHLQDLADRRQERQAARAETEAEIRKPSHETSIKDFCRLLVVDAVGGGEDPGLVEEGGPAHVEVLGLLQNGRLGENIML